EFQGADATRRIQEELSQLRPKELLYASAAPLFETSTGSAQASVTPTKTAVDARPQIKQGYAETALDDWIFAPDHAIPLLENHFGVLSLEGFGLAGKPAAAS